MKTPLLLLLVLVFNLSAIAQDSEKELRKYLVSVRTDLNTRLPQSVLTDTRKEVKLLSVLEPFFHDSAAVVRQKSFYVSKRIGQRSKSSETQRIALRQIVQGLQDQDPAIVGACIESLKGFRMENFTKEVRAAIGASLSPATPHLDQLLLVAGSLQLQNEIPRVESLLHDNVSASVKSAARLALARMGDPQAIRWIQTRLTKISVNDDFVYDVAPQLAYTCNASLYEFLTNVINSEERNCSSSNPDHDEKQPCGYQVLTIVAPYIKDFPIAISATGDLAKSDYHQALIDARLWLAAHPKIEFRADVF